MVRKCATISNKAESSENIMQRDDVGDMGKEERKRQVLKLLVESGLDLPPAVIFHNCKKRGSTFERRSVDNYLGELVDEGYVERIDDSKGYYRATPDGRDHYLNS